MARTHAYQRQVDNQVRTINRHLKGVEEVFGVESQQYERYKNAISAALPKGAYTINPETGQIRVSTKKADTARLKMGQVKAPARLPTAKQSVRAAKRSLAQNKLHQQGVKAPTRKEIEKEVVTVSDREALEELAAKDYIESIENESGMLNYDESVKEEMKELGAKSYTQLKEIMERGRAKAEKRRRAAEASRRYRARHRDEINARRRVQRAARREASRRA